MDLTAAPLNPARIGGAAPVLAHSSPGPVPLSSTPAAELSSPPTNENPMMEKGKGGKKKTRGPDKQPRKSIERNRCRAHLSDGSGRQCRKSAIKGGYTCRVHGSATEAAKTAASARLEDCRPDLIKELHRIVERVKESDNPIAHWKVLIALADRVGLGPSRKVDISGSQTLTIDGEATIHHEVFPVDSLPPDISLLLLYVRETGDVPSLVTDAIRASLAVEIVDGAPKVAKRVLQNGHHLSQGGNSANAYTTSTRALPPANGATYDVPATPARHPQQAPHGTTPASDRGLTPEPAPGPPPGDHVQGGTALPSTGATIPTSNGSGSHLSQPSVSGSAFPSLPLAPTPDTTSSHGVAFTNVLEI